MENELSDEIEVFVHRPLTSRHFFHSTSDSRIRIDVKGSTKIMSPHLALKKKIDDYSD